MKNNLTNPDLASPPIKDPPIDDPAIEDNDHQVQRSLAQNIPPTASAQLDPLSKRGERCPIIGSLPVSTAKGTSDEIILIGIKPFAAHSAAHTDKGHLEAESPLENTGPPGKAPDKEIDSSASAKIGGPDSENPFHAIRQAVISAGRRQDEGDLQDKSALPAQEGEHHSSRFSDDLANLIETEVEKRLEQRYHDQAKTPPIKPEIP